MKQVRKVSNLVAEELQSALKDSGITLNESAFEEKVSEIVADIYESVYEASDVSDDDEEVAVTEDGKFYYAAAECTIGGVNVKEGEYVEIEDTDDGKVATIYDEDGDVRESDVFVDDKDDYEDSLEELEDEDFEEDELEEDISKAAFKKQQKNLAKGKTKGGKRKIKGALLMKLKKNLAKARKKAHTGMANMKRKKTVKKRDSKNFYDGASSGTVAEAFDIHSDTMTFTVEAGDVLVMEDDMLNVVREGNTIIKGIPVSEGFFDRCYEAEVLEAEKAEEETEEEETKAEECGSAKADEGKKCAGCKESDEEDFEEEETNESTATLTFKADNGYTLVREGKELPMGNRVRARATLIHEGFNITSEMLDKAVQGEVVTL